LFSNKCFKRIVGSVGVASSGVLPEHGQTRGQGLRWDSAGSCLAPALPASPGGEMQLLLRAGDNIHSITTWTNVSPPSSSVSAPSLRVSMALRALARESQPCLGRVLSCC